MPREEVAIVREIHEAMDVPENEAELYVRAMKAGRLLPQGPEEKALAQNLSARGMVIQAAAGSYLPVHPRMALSNLFRTYEEKAARQRKEKRLLVDRLTLELITLLPEESKGTNAGAHRGGRK